MKPNQAMEPTQKKREDDRADLPCCAYCGREIRGAPVEQSGLWFDTEEHAAHAEHGE